MAEGRAVNGEGDACLIQIDNHGRHSQLPLEQGKITGVGETAPHFATLAGNTEFVSNLVNSTDECQLTNRDQESNTAFFFAASNGAKEIAQAMLAKEPDLPYRRGRGSLLPIHMAASRGQTGMVELLYENADLGLLEQDDRIYLLVSLIKSDMLAIAMDMINDGGEGLLLLKDRDGETVLSAVAQKFQMLSSSRSSICSFSGSTDVRDKKVSELLDLICKKLDESQMKTLVGEGWDIAFFAAENGNAEFLRTLIDYYPDLLTRTNKDGHTISDVAVLHRQKKGGNPMLQLAAQLARSNRLACGTGNIHLQLQQEELWFKNHQELIEIAQAWVRGMANLYMFVAALSSAVAYVVPGGTNQNTGYPMFLPDIAYKIFAVAQAISIVSSVASVLIFLSLHMSTYSLENFVRQIPIKLLIGLAIIFVSISALMVCSGTAFFMYFKPHNLYIKYVVPMALLFCLPPLMFFWLNKGLVFAIVKSTPFTLNHKITTPGFNLPRYRTCIDHCV